MWMNSDTNPNFKGDDETLKKLIIKYGTKACLNPEKIEVRSRKTWELVTNTKIPQIYQYFDAKNGFKCVNKQQKSEFCHDYEIRLCCPGNLTKIVQYS